MDDDMHKTIINPESFVKPSGYSNAVMVEGGRVLFLAGQTGMDHTGAIAHSGDLVAQFNKALENIQVVIEEAGGAMTDIVKLTLFVTDKAAYKANLKPIGAAYRAFFGRYYPAMTLLEVKSLFDDHALIEIEGFAVIG
jgi:enamine deaminase RidA (YjgF/YER057c/UK114 family)